MKKQSGFAVLESLLVFIIIAVIGGIGWYAIHTKHQTDKILSQADKISQSTPNIPTEPTAKDGYLTVREWGVKMPAKLTNLSYVYKAQEPKDWDLLRFKADEIGQDSKACGGSSNVGVWGIARLVPTDPIGPFDDVMAKDAPASAGLKKIGDYYYKRTAPQMLCGEAARAIDTQIENAAQEMFNGLQAISQ